jgi:homogentisate phytyltransferase/homogentisate geranylgeranyltransferase
MHGIALLVQFGRPHTIIATTTQVLTLFVMTAGLGALRPQALLPLLLTLVCCLALNIYIVGLNQLTDLEIDRINKPSLPLASGALSLREGQAITWIAAALCLLLAAAAGPYLMGTVAAIFLIGTLYSLPPIRLKRYAIWAAISIALARGLIANAGVALHYRQIFGGNLPAATLVMLGCFFFGFAIVIALYKDIPDSAGDRMFRIETFTTRLGGRRVFQLGRLILSACYALPIAFALATLPQTAAWFLLLSHALLIGLFWAASMRVMPEQPASMARFYLFLWALFYAEFVVLSVYTLLV